MSQILSFAMLGESYISNKKLRSNVKLFLNNKGCISNDFVSVEKDGELIRNEKKLVELFNQNYISMVFKKLYQFILTVLAFKKLKSTFNSDSRFELEMIRTPRYALQFEIFEKMPVILLYWFLKCTRHLDAKNLALFNQNLVVEWNELTPSF